jgi:hypothetical protein
LWEFLEIFMIPTYLQYAEGETRAEVFDDGDSLQRGARLPRTPHPTGETMIDRWDQIQIQVFGSGCGLGLWIPDSARQNLPTKIKKKINKIIWRVLDVLLGALGASPVA